MSAPARLPLLHFAGPAAALLLSLTAPSALARLAPSLHDFDGVNASSLPARLSATGLYGDPAAPARRVSEGIVAFDVNSPLWSDKAHKERFVALPAGARIVPTDTDHYQFPDKTVMIKNFALDTVYGDSRTRILVETRFLVFRKGTSGGEWHGITYRWRPDQADADRVDGEAGLDAIIDVRINGTRKGMRWRYPSRYDCSECHKGRGSLGFITPQLNRPATGNPAVNQLEDLFRKGVLPVNPIAGKAGVFRWVAVEEQGASLEQRTRSYLAANCSHCHGNGQMPGPSHDFDYLRPAKPILHGVDPLGGYVGKPGLAFPMLIYPGFPDSSEILAKQSSRGDPNLQMPPLATYQIDSAALRTLAKWVCQLGGKDTAAAACRPAAIQADSTFWTLPTALRHRGRAGAAPAPSERPRLRGSLLEVPASFEDGGEIRLSDLRGRRIPILRRSRGAYRVFADLERGIYLLRAGTRVLPLDCVP